MAESKTSSVSGVPQGRFRDIASRLVLACSSLNGRPDFEDRVSMIEQAMAAEVNRERSAWRSRLVNLIGKADEVAR